MDETVLQKIGLSKNEIKVYLELLAQGESTSGPLIKNTALNSSKVYENLARLQKKGLVSYVKKTNKKYFQAANPERLLEYMDEKKKLLEDEKSEIEKILPEIKANMKMSQDEKQEATIYQGSNGYRTLLEIMISELGHEGQYIAFASGMLKKVLGPYWFIFQEKKKKNHIKARCLWDSKVKKQKDYLKEYYGSGRFIMKGSYSNPVDIWVYNDKIIQVSYSTKPIFAVLIKSKGLANSYKELFENLWKTAKQ